MRNSLVSSVHDPSMWRLHALTSVYRPPAAVPCCRYCANFTLTQLQPLFKNKLINHVQLDIIPYGNAHTDPNTGAVAQQGLDGSAAEAHGRRHVCTSATLVKPSLCWLTGWLAALPGDSVCV